MKRISVKDKDGLQIFCPFCGVVAISNDGLETCKHTLFHASDEGFEYIRGDLPFDTEVDMGHDNMDEFLKKIEFSESVQFTVCQPSPSFFCGYVAFSSMTSKDS